MWKSPLDLKIWPAVCETIDGRLFGDEESVAIGLIEVGEGFDQIDGVGFVSGELRSDRMRVNSNVHVRATCTCRWLISRGGGLTNIQPPAIRRRSDVYSLPSAAPPPLPTAAAPAMSAFWRVSRSRI